MTDVLSTDDISIPLAICFVKPSMAVDAASIDRRIGNGGAAVDLMIDGGTIYIVPTDPSGVALQIDAEVLFDLAVYGVSSASTAPVVERAPAEKIDILNGLLRWLENAVRSAS